MGIIERRAREREALKRQILEKTRALIFEFGVNEVTIQRIVDTTEMSKAGIYSYFGGKDALLIEILDTAVEEFIAYVEASLHPSDSGLEAFNKLWRAFLSCYIESNEIFILTGIRSYVEPNFFLAPRKGVHPISLTTRRLCTVIEEILNRGAADGTLRKLPNAAQTADTVFFITMSIVDGVARLPNYQRDTGLIKTEIERAQELIIHGLAIEGSFTHNTEES